MPPARKVCPECDWEGYAFHLPSHLYREHGIGEPPRTRGQAKSSTGGGSAVRREAAADPPPPSEETTGPPDEAPPGSAAELAPRKPGLIERFRSRRGRGRGGQHQGPASAERPPRRPGRPRGRRVALDTDLSDIWAFAGRRLERTPHYPTGRMLQYQAPAAGVIIDRAIAGTLPDRVLFQPIARNRDKYEDVGFLLAGPLLTFTITTTMQQIAQAQADQDEEAFHNLVGKLEMQREMFTWVLQMMLPRLAAGKKLAEEKKRKRDDAIADAFPELAAGEDPAEVLATMLFTPPTFQEASTNGNAGEPDHATAAPSPEGSIPFGG